MGRRSYSLDEVRAVKPRALEVFAPLVGEVGVGIVRAGEGYGLKVNLQKAPPVGTSLPTEVDGVPVRIEVVGVPKAQ